MKLFDLSHPASKARSGFKIWKRTACVMLAGSLLLSLTACGGRVAKTVTRTVYQEKEVQTVAPAQAGRELHTASTSLKQIAQSGLIELYIDETTYAVAVKETSQNKMWYALPQQDNGKEENAPRWYPLRCSRAGSIILSTARTTACLRHRIL